MRYLTLALCIAVVVSSPVMAGSVSTLAGSGTCSSCGYGVTDPLWASTTLLDPGTLPYFVAGGPGNVPAATGVYPSITDGLETLLFSPSAGNYLGWWLPFDDQAPYFFPWAGTLNITFASPVTVFGFELWDTSFWYDSFTVTFFGANYGETASQTVSLNYWSGEDGSDCSLSGNPVSGFDGDGYPVGGCYMAQFAAQGIGTTITGVQISANNFAAQGDMPAPTNFQYDLGDPVPEPSVFLMFGSGLFGMAVFSPDS